MPAPVPIQIRYDNAGVLGAAAAAAGSGQAWNQQHQMDMQLIMQQIQAKQNAALMQQQSDAQMNQLQQAHDMQMQQAQANQPAPDNYFKMSDIGGPSTAMKQMGLEAAKAAGVNGPELAMLESAAGNKNINAAYFENIKDETIKRAKTTADKSQNVKEKNAYLDSLGNTVPPENMTYLKSLAGADDISLPQFTTKIQEMRQNQAATAKEGDMLKKAVAAESIRAIDDKINFAQSELASQERELNTKHQSAAVGGGSGAVANYKVERTPLMQASEIMLGGLPGGQAINDLQGQLRSVTQTTEGDPMGLKLRLDIAHKRQEIAAYQKTRDDIISQFGAAAPAQSSSQIVQVSTPDQAMSLPSGTQFMTPDGRIKVRP